MATKDWKRVKIDAFRINYHRTKPNVNIYIKYFDKRWIIDIFPVKGKFINKLKSFKTKNQALAYAKAYRRKK